MRSLLFALALLAGACEHPRGTTMLPTTRNETASPSDPVSSDTINDLQDCTIGKKYPSIYKWRGLGRGGLETNASFDNGGGVYAGQLRSTGAMVVDGIVLDGYDIGTRVTGLKVRCEGTGGVHTAHVFLQLAKDGVISNLGDLAIVNPGAVATYTLDPLTVPNHVLAEGEHLVLKITTGIAGTQFGAVGIGTDRL